MSILKVTNENSRIRSRIRTKISRTRNTDLTNLMNVLSISEKNRGTFTSIMLFVSSHVFCAVLVWLLEATGAAVAAAAVAAAVGAAAAGAAAAAEGAAGALLAPLLLLLASAILL